MKTAIVLAVGLAVLATGTWAQDASRDREDYGRGGWRETRDGWDRDGDRRRGPMMREDNDEGREDRLGRGARFFLRSGDTQLRIACGNRESTQAGVDAALRLFDRMQSQPGSAGRSPPTSTPVPAQLQ